MIAGSERYSRGISTIHGLCTNLMPLDGAILIDKPAGPTSHDVVDAIRSQFRLKKVGHCGTLDPNATGLLIIVLGRGTKLSEKLMSPTKFTKAR